MMDCPKCGKAMEVVAFGDVEVDRCTGCAGLWFDMLEHEDLKALAGSEVIDTGPAELGKAQDRHVRIACPACGVPMIAMVVAGQAHISYEACTVCYGVYFDAGEFTDYREETLRETMNALFSRH